MVNTVNITSHNGVTEWMVGIVVATSIEANHGAIRPLYIIAVVSVHCIGLDDISDHNPLESVTLWKSNNRFNLYRVTLLLILHKSYSYGKCIQIYRMRFWLHAWARFQTYLFTSSSKRHRAIPSGNQHPGSLEGRGILLWPHEIWDPLQQRVRGCTLPWSVCLVPNLSKVSVVNVSPIGCSDKGCEDSRVSFIWE